MRGFYEKMKEKKLKKKKKKKKQMSVEAVGHAVL